MFERGTFSLVPEQRSIQELLKMSEQDLCQKFVVEVGMDVMMVLRHLIDVFSEDSSRSIQARCGHFRTELQTIRGLHRQYHGSGTFSMGPRSVTKEEMKKTYSNRPFILHFIDALE